ncbi:MAG: energy transducer TonB [Acetobacteraceae bacterium]
MAVAGFVTDRLPSARRRRRALPPFIASVLLHAMVLSLLLVGIRLQPREPEWLPPPAMDMVFEGGAKQAPSVANPTPEQPNLPPSPPPLPVPPVQPVPPTPPVPRAPPAPQPASPPAAPPQETASPPAEHAVPPQFVSPPAAPPQETLPPPVQREAPPRPAPPTPEAATPRRVPPIQTVTPPVEAPPIVLPPPTPLPAEPVPAPKPPPSPAAKPAAQPAQPPMESSIQLIPPPALPLQPLPLLRPQRPTRPAPPHPHQRVRPAPNFPAPMAYSFGGPVQANPAVPRPLGRRPGIELSFAPVGRFSDRSQPDVRSDDPDVGPDWLNLVSAWWQRHAWYPPEAGINNEQGTVTVRLIVAHDGKVESVRLEDRSGKPFLDMGAVAIFRGATLPPLPPRVKTQSIPVHFTIHYIIVG